MAENTDQVPPPVVEEASPAIEDVVTDNVVKNILKSYNPDMTLVSFEAELGSQAGDNYMSIMYAVTIKTKSNSTGVEGETLHVMLKTMPQNAFRQEMINDMKAFEKESKVYSVVLRDFLQFQKDKGIGEDDMFTAFPNCYSTFCDGQKDYLALENLRFTGTGYGMSTRVPGVDEAHAKVVITNLAKFHAISFAIFEGDYDKILTKYPFLEERWFKKPEDVPEMSKMFLSQTFKMEGEQLRNAGFPAEGSLIEGVFDSDFFGRMYRMVGSHCKNAVINHGDCWTNNMLFAYDSNGKIKDHKFIDFQISRPSPRALDLNYFLYSSPRMEILNNQEESLLRLYHDEFTRFANKLGYFNEDLTFEALKEEFQTCRSYGVTMGLMLAPMLSADKNDIPDMEKMDMPTDEKGLEDSTKEFMGGIMKNDLLTQKLRNFAQIHIPKCINDFTKNS